MNDDDLDLLKRVAVLLHMFEEAVECRELELTEELAEALTEVKADVDMSVETEVLMRPKRS